MNLKTARDKILKRISDYDNFAIVISTPDEDSVGSSLALKEMLAQKNKNSVIYSSKQVDNFSYLSNIEDIMIADVSQLKFSDFSTLIVLDSSSPSRTITQKKRAKYNDKEFQFPEETFIINIDHHENTNFGDINYINDKVSSVGEIIIHLFKGEFSFSTDISTDLMAAILGDTNCFKNPNVSKTTFEATSFLLRKQARYHYLIQKIYFSKNIETVKKNIRILSDLRIKTVKQIKYAYAIVHKKYFNNQTPPRSSIQLSYDILKTIKKVDFIVIVKPGEKNITKLSFRSQSFNVKKLAQNLDPGGGGHNKAAGATLQGNSKDALESLNTLLLKT